MQQPEGVGQPCRNYCRRDDSIRGGATAKGDPENNDTASLEEQDTSGQKSQCKRKAVGVAAQEERCEQRRTQDCNENIIVRGRKKSERCCKRRETLAAHDYETFSPGLD